MSVQKEVIKYTATRMVFSSSKPLPEVIAALEEELNKEKAGMGVLQLLGTAKDREEIERGLGSLLEGKRDFL